jgi:hypothetical protein
MPTRFLPDRPNLTQYKKQAKELVKALRSADADALARVRAHHPRLSAVTESDARLAAFVLADAQLVIAREHGIELAEIRAGDRKAIRRRFTSTRVEARRARRDCGRRRGS